MADPLPVLTLEDDPEAAAVILDAIPSGDVYFLCGYTGAEALAQLNRYVTTTHRNGVTEINGNEIKYVDGDVSIWFGMECSYTMEQDWIWTKGMPTAVEPWDYALAEDNLMLGGVTYEMWEDVFGGPVPLPPIPVQSFVFTAGELPDGVTFIRASAAHWFDADGDLKAAAVDEPRFVGDTGLLVEVAKANLLLDNVMADALYTSGVITHNDLNENLFGLFPVQRIESNGSLSVEVRGGPDARVNIAPSQTVTYRVIYRGGTSGNLWFRLTDMNTGLHIRTDGPCGSMSITEASYGSGHILAEADHGNGICEAAITFTNNSAANYDIRIGVGPFSATTGQYVDGIAVTAELGGATSYIDGASRAADTPGITGVPAGTYDARVTFADRSQTDLHSVSVSDGWWPSGLPEVAVVSRIDIFPDGSL